MKASKSIKTLAAAMAVVMVMAAAAFAQSSYIITGSGTSFSAVKVPNTPVPGASNQPIQTVINAIKDDVIGVGGPGVTPLADNNDVIIRFGTEDVLDIGSATVTFGNVGGSVWPNITLNGKITSAPQVSMTEGLNGTVNIASGVSVTTTADIASTNSNPAITVRQGGTVNIWGGTVTATSWNGPAISSERIGAAIGNIILDGSPTINGFIDLEAGKLSVATTFTPQGRVQYTLGFWSNTATVGTVAVVGGADYVDNFTLIDNNVTLTKSGNDLVLSDKSETTRVVTFNSQGGSFVTPQNVPQGGKVTKPADPTRDGYTFDAWHLSRECSIASEECVPNPLWNFETDVVTSNITLFAKWTTVPASVTHRGPVKGGQFGILQNGASLRVVGTAQATRIRVYDVRGKVLLSRAALPNERISVSHLARGTYVVKAAGKSVKLVRR